MLGKISQKKLGEKVAYLHVSPWFYGKKKKTFNCFCTDTSVSCSDSDISNNQKKKK